uniref:PX domain-containing protein n=1 Tax=Hyaloperonospora arabidopsidis (strain Emoy2) TaxID=559515 RepID=M4BEU7_HYAAE
MGCTHSKTHAKKKDVFSIGKLPVVMETTWSDIGLQFVPGEVSINEYGIAYYNFDGFNPADSHQEIHVCKRYSEFKSLYVDMCKLIRREDKYQMSPSLPSMPPANAVTFVLGRGNEIVVKAREAQFLKLLNAMASHPIASQSKLFTRFID